MQCLKYTASVLQVAHYMSDVLLSEGNTGLFMALQKKNVLYNCMY